MDTRHTLGETPTARLTHSRSTDNGLGTLGETVPELRTKLQELVDSGQSGGGLKRSPGKSSGSLSFGGVLMAVSCVAAIGFLMRR